MADGILPSPCLSSPYPYKFSAPTKRRGILSAQNIKFAALYHAPRNFKKQNLAEQIALNFANGISPIVPDPGR